MPTQVPQPVLKWAGGKSQLLRDLMGVVPADFGTYYEPFAGGAALFFALASQNRIRRAVLSDLNADLLNLYRVLQSAPAALVGELKTLEQHYLSLEHDERAMLFYEVRGRQEADPVVAAARLVFLNKTCFNGLFRVNRAGVFNVPHGSYKSPKICNEEVLGAASRALQLAEIRGPTDFQFVADKAHANDFVYFDPPYQPLSATSSFTGYTSEEFDWAAQLRLKAVFDSLVGRNVSVVLSNSAHPEIVALYAADHEVRILEARRSINSRSDRRGKISELLVLGQQRQSSIETEKQPEPVLEVV
jgi:DNA adenine methylase